MSAGFAQNQPVPERGPALAGDLVKDFVVAAHGNVDRTKALLDATPSPVRIT